MSTKRKERKETKLGQPTWEDVKREKEERLRKAKRERSLSTPLKSTSIDAMDTEEAHEFSKEIAAKAAEKELRKQRYAEYQLKTTRYDLPRPGSIPVPQLEKPKEKKEPRPQSVLSNFGTPNYEEISTCRQRPPSRSRSVSAAPMG